MGTASAAASEVRNRHKNMVVTVILHVITLETTVRMKEQVIKSGIFSGIFKKVTKQCVTQWTIISLFSLQTAKQQFELSLKHHIFCLFYDINIHLFLLHLPSTVGRYW